MTGPPEALPYYSIVYIYSVWVYFTLAAFNDIDIRAYDIGKSYLNTKFREKIWKKIRYQVLK